MPKLIIDQREIEVPQGTKVIEAAERLGITIPRFCYHPALGSVGACRVCAVRFLEGPVSGVMMSCMIDAQDGMKVSTTDPAAVDFRKQVIEWLMLNHPHDCPVCDEGGRCLLQDITIAGGHGMRRFAFDKRTFPDQDLGPLLQHEMNRCIHCFRCSRYYQEFTGYRDLGVLGIGNRTMFARFKPGPLESPFSGNLADICPTGVFTDKPARHRGRRWDEVRTPSICLHCSLGCHVTVAVRARRVERQEARFSDAVNGHFICDRGRYGYAYAQNAQRPMHPRLDGRDAAIKEVCDFFQTQLGQAAVSSGSGSIAMAGSSRCSLETLVHMTRLAQSHGWRPPAFLCDGHQVAQCSSAMARLEPEIAVSLRQLEAADFLLILGVDPIHEAPMLALALRQAQRKGARIVVCDPRPVTLPCDFTHLPLPIDLIDVTLSAWLKAVIPRHAALKLGPSAIDLLANATDVDLSDVLDSESQAAMLADLRDSRRPIIVCGTCCRSPQLPGRAADAALMLRAMDKAAGVFNVLPGPNAFAAALLTQQGDSLEDLLHDIENGSVRALILVECDPFTEALEPDRLRRALERLDFFAVIDYLPSEAGRQAHVFLPSATVYEAGGHFVNQEGRLQCAPPALNAPLQTDPAADRIHPPRDYRIDPSAKGAMPAWRVLAHMDQPTAEPLQGGPTPPDSQALVHEITALLGDRVIAIAPSQSEPDGAWLIRLKSNPETRFAPPGISTRKSMDPGTFSLSFVDCTFGTEILSSQSPCLQELVPEPFLAIHPSDADDLALRDGDHVRIAPADITLLVRVFPHMAPGTLWLPRHHQLNWQGLITPNQTLHQTQIKKC